MRTRFSRRRDILQPPKIDKWRELDIRAALQDSISTTIFTRATDKNMVTLLVGHIHQEVINHFWSTEQSLTHILGLRDI